jgi:hypothetical protein
MMRLPRFATRCRIAVIDHRGSYTQKAHVPCVAKAMLDDAQSLLVKNHHISVDHVDRKTKRRLEAGRDRILPWERPSVNTPTNHVSKDEIIRFASTAPTPLHMNDWLDMSQPASIAKFLHVEVLVRLAERIHCIEEIPEWDESPEFSKVHTLHVEAFRELRFVKRKHTLDLFTEVVQRVVKSFDNMQHDLASGLQRLHKARGDDYGSQFADKWLEHMLLNWTSTQRLMSQYLTCIEGNGASYGKAFSACMIDEGYDFYQDMLETKWQNYVKSN